MHLFAYSLHLQQDSLYWFLMNRYFISTLSFIVLAIIALPVESQLALEENGAGFMLANCSYHNGRLSFSLSYNGDSPFEMAFTGNRKISFTPLPEQLKVQYTIEGKPSEDKSQLYNGPKDQGQYWVGFSISNIKPEIGNQFLPVLINNRFSALIPLFRFPLHLVHLPLYPSSVLPIKIFQVNTWEHAIVLYSADYKNSEIKVHWGEEPPMSDSVKLDSNGAVPVRWNHEKSAYTYTENSRWGKGWLMKLGSKVAIGKVVRSNQNQEQKAATITLTGEGYAELRFNSDYRDFNKLTESTPWEEFLKEAKNVFDEKEVGEL